MNSISQAEVVESSERTAVQSARFDWFEIFSFMWAVALLAHMGKGGHFASSKPHVMLLTAGSVLLLLHPGSLALFTAVLVVQLVGIVIDLPLVTNHWYFMTLSHVAMLLCMVGLAIAQHGRVDRQAFFRAYRPALAASLILLYVLVTVCKINTDFFDPAKSAAAGMYGWLTNKLPVLADTRTGRLFVIWCTLLIEGGIPLLLIFPATRVAGLLVGWAFHFVLGFNGFSDFSALMLACYVAFLPNDFPARLRAVVDEDPRIGATWMVIQRAFQHPVAPYLLIGLALAPSVLGMLQVVPFELLRRVTILGSRLLWMISAVIVLWFYLAAIRRPKPETAPKPVEPASDRLARVLAWSGPLLILANGLTPYVGLKTDSAFTMFSNLQTEGENWNHLFLPKAMRVFPFQNDLVEVIDSSDPHLRSASREGTRWIYFEFQDYMSRRPDASVIYVYRGERREVPRVAEDPILSKPVNPVLRKLFFFRSVVPPERNVLRH